MSKIFIDLSIQKYFTLSKKGDISRRNLGVAIRSASSSLINGPDKILGYKSTSLSCICLIENGASI